MVEDEPIVFVADGQYELNEFELQEGEVSKLSMLFKNSGENLYGKEYINGADLKTIEDFETYENAID